MKISQKDSFYKNTKLRTQFLDFLTLCVGGHNKWFQPTALALSCGAKVFFAFPDLCDTKEPFRQKFTIIMMRYSVVSGNLQMQIINFHPTHCAK